MISNGRIAYLFDTSDVPTRKMCSQMCIRLQMSGQCGQRSLGMSGIVAGHRVGSHGLRRDAGDLSENCSRKIVAYQSNLSRKPI